MIMEIKLIEPPTTIKKVAAYIRVSTLKEEQIYKMLDKTNTKTIFYSRYCKSIFENNQNKYDKYKIEDIPLYIDEVKEIKTNINLDVNKVCTIFFTSGTTGFNKAVMLSHKNIADNTYNIDDTHNIEGSESNESTSNGLIHLRYTGRDGLTPYEALRGAENYLRDLGPAIDYLINKLETCFICIYDI